VPAIHITLISRLGKRRILNEASVLEAIESTYADKVKVTVVHFEALSFPEQVSVVR
jgi:hypothetical protein